MTDYFFYATYAFILAAMLILKATPLEKIEPMGNFFKKVLTPITDIVKLFKRKPKSE